MNEDIADKGLVRRFVPGDLLWTKLGGYPFWPCMVSYDPVDGSFTKITKTKCKNQAIYHVQYFGEVPQRGWTIPGNSFPFEGKKAFLDKKAQLEQRKTKNGGSKVLLKLISKYKIPIITKQKWEFAVTEAEEALKCTDKKKRFETYVFKFETLKKKPSIIVNGLSVRQNRVSPKYFQQMINDSKKARLSVDSLGGECDICNIPPSDVSCSGTCKKFFHVGCLGMTNIPENFKCAECSSDDFSCFVCKKSNGDVKKCSHSKCSKHYHSECLKQFECTNIEKYICPLHTCVTCYRENPRNVMSHKGAMVKCIKCPTAFHLRESCTAAGSKELTATTIICPYHFIGKYRISPIKPCNMNYCTLCDQGGKLICCEACPNAFHESCLETNVTKEDFICEDCENRKHLLYGMIVWAKIGKYRWWPAKIMHPSKLPDNIKEIHHYDGEFAIQYFGTRDYSWIHSGRVFPYDDVHKKCRVPNSNKFKEQYKKSLEEAAEAYDQYQIYRLSESLSGEQPEAYKHIRVNRALPPAQITTVDMHSILQCSCDPTRENPCGLESDCLNRSMLIECHPDICKAKDLCCNQKFQKKQYAPTKIIRTKDCGWGLASLQGIKKGEFVTEYVGEVITHEEYQRRSGELQANGCANYYFLYLDSRRMIDAGPMGNLSRFINHSCDPNCEMVKWSVNGDARIGIFALKDIMAGEELTFNYQSDKYEFEQKCLCSAANCRGFIGRKSVTALKTPSSASKLLASKTASSLSKLLYQNLLQ